MSWNLSLTLPLDDRSLVSYESPEYQTMGRDYQGLANLYTLGSWTNAPALLLGGRSPVVMNLRHSMIVWGEIVATIIC